MNLLSVLKNIQNEDNKICSKKDSQTKHHLVHLKKWTSTRYVLKRESTIKNTGHERENKEYHRSSWVKCRDEVYTDDTMRQEL